MKRDFDPKNFPVQGAALARLLTARGYRRVSNRYRIVARVDRPDWPRKNAHGAPLGPDFYRRVVSQDWIEGIPLYVYRLIPASNHDNVGYVAFEDAEEVDPEGILPSEY